MKRTLILLTLLVITALLAACQYTEQELYYKGQLRPVSQVEEIISDELEVENPDLDLEVDVYEEEEDD